MIYLDTSVVLAHLLAEDRTPPPSLWREALVSSRLLEYEVWVRIHGRGLTRSHSDAARQTLARVGFLELVPPVLERALEPFPITLRTLDALHVASIVFLRGLGQRPRLASYDDRMLKAAEKLGIAVHPC